MRIICNQCGRNIHSELCAKYCNQEKRWKQFNEADKECKKFINEIKMDKNKINKINKIKF